MNRKKYWIQQRMELLDPIIQMEREPKTPGVSRKTKEANQGDLFQGFAPPCRTEGPGSGFWFAKAPHAEAMTPETCKLKQSSNEKMQGV